MLAVHVIAGRANETLNFLRAEEESSSRAKYEDGCLYNIEPQKRSVGLQGGSRKLLCAATISHGRVLLQVAHLCPCTDGLVYLY